MNIIEDPVIPDSYKTTVINYHLAQLALGNRCAETLYRNRISALTGWIKKKRREHLTISFIDICLELACEDAEKLAKKLYSKDPTLTSLDEWGIV